MPAVIRLTFYLYSLHPGFNDMVNRFVPERVTSFSDKGSWSMLSGGQHHTVALDSKGKKMCWYFDLFDIFFFLLSYFCTVCDQSFICSSFKIVCVTVLFLFVGVIDQMQSFVLQGKFTPLAGKIMGVWVQIKTVGRSRSPRWFLPCRILPVLMWQQEAVLALL